MAKFLRLTKKTHFVVILAQIEFFLNILAKYDYSGPQHLNVKDTD